MCLVLTIMVSGQSFTAALDRKRISSRSFFSVRMRVASLVAPPRLSWILSHSAFGNTITWWRSTSLGRKYPSRIILFSKLCRAVQMEEKILRLLDIRKSCLYSSLYQDLSSCIVTVLSYPYCSLLSPMPVQQSWDRVSVSGVLTMASARTWAVALTDWTVWCCKLCDCSYVCTGLACGN